MKAASSSRRTTGRCWLRLHNLWEHIPGPKVGNTMPPSLSMCRGDSFEGCCPMWESQRRAKNKFPELWDPPPLHHYERCISAVQIVQMRVLDQA